ncbi:DNA mismatch repair protein MutS [Fundicoccus culcitae]|uniref:DNA mismatch repair protein MutS n=1 Tax=Fundicoccus culcitae TaxID=2969821 RepID=A0ABY5P753_9LACT|nr:DNA mismatch repair protein MutS [Fundicoccus culcitae]UUX34562.1 DNA mismatch repair protein MutS [Fundicoccus culcitae]
MAKATTTPMMEQYNQIKAQYPDAFLFFRLGDFYEMFNEDALKASKILEITLTSRNKNAENPIPMCGVPYHSAQTYIQRLIEAGHKVAICEQMEDPKATKGMVKREVVQVITPGTILQDEALESKENHYLASVAFIDDLYYLAYIDVSTGDAMITSTPDRLSLINEIRTLAIKELVYYQQDAEWVKELKEKVTTHYSYFPYNEKEANVEFSWDLKDANQAERHLLDYLFGYLFNVQKKAAQHVKPIERYEISSFLQMNYYAKTQLELTRSLRTQRKKGSLLWLLDKTETAMGGRLLHQWLDKPLLSMQTLEKRHERVETLINMYFERVELTESFVKIYDLERLVSKISLGTANARDMGQLRQSLRQIPLINDILVRINQEQMNGLNDHEPQFLLLDEHTALEQLLEDVLVEDPPISLTEGNIIKSGYNAKLDEYRESLENGQQWLMDLQKTEREKTGLKTLKVGYNKVFGYYIEISRLQAAQLNDDRYHRKQTLSNNERYITDELKAIEEKIMEATEKSTDLEYQIFLSLRQTVNESIKTLQTLARQIAELDVLCNFAKISEEEGYVRPILTTDNQTIELVESRHPVVEHLIGSTNFVANDVKINSDQYLLLLTGPNMSGKSTYMRQVAYAVILNQIGCFVPAKKAIMPIIDKIFTRIGSSDDISSGQSTFMVEMMETQQALSQATSRSLLLFDEIGRGTATFDGMALAEAIIHYIAKKVKATTIFSTHYHELTALENSIDTLKNIHVGATEHEGELVFLHKIFDGPADKSYGIHVAKLAGLPDEIIQHSQAILIELESNAALLRQTEAVQLDLFKVEEEASTMNKETNSVDQEVIARLQKQNLNQTTPMEALQLLQELQNELS